MIVLLHVRLLIIVLMQEDELKMKRQQLFHMKQAWAGMVRYKYKYRLELLYDL